MAIREVVALESSATGTSTAIIPKPGNPFNIGFGVVVSATATYTVEHTFDGVNWFTHESIVDATTNEDGNYAFPVAGIRLNVSANSGDVTLTTLQAY